MCRPLGSALLVTLALSFGAGCTGRSPQQAWLEVGTGEWKFERLDDGQPVELVAGAQGGHHVWVSVIAGGIEPQGAELEIETRLVERDLQTSHRELSVDLDARPGKDGHEFIGWTAVQSKAPCVVDERLLVRATITDDDGSTAGDERIVIPTPDPATAPDGACELQ